MWPGVEHVAASSVLLAHLALVPAGAGVIAALVLLSPPVRVGAMSGGDTRDPRIRDLREMAIHHRLADQMVFVTRTSVEQPLPMPLRTRTLWQLAAVTTAASAVVHAAAGPDHAKESLVLGLFFFACAVAQFVWTTVALITPTRMLIWEGVLSNVFLIVLWAVSRTVGIPVLLHGPEPVGLWDLSAKIWELGALACCVALLLQSRSPRREWAWLTPVTARRLVWATAVASVLGLLALGLAGPPS